MSTDEGAGEAVQGERAAAAVHRPRGMQSRLGSVLALGLMMALGFGALCWYYAHIWSAHDRIRRQAQGAALAQAQGELPLPSLGRIDPPKAAIRAPPPGADAPQAPAMAPPPLEVAPALSSDLTAYAAGSGDPADSSAQTPAESALERRLSGAAFLAENTAGDAETAAAPQIGRPPASAGGALQSLLQPTTTTTVRALRLPTTRMLLPKGAFIDCTLETAIDSTLPGYTTCITAIDTFGADGEVVLLARGTKLVGEVRGQVQQGMARVFVLWTEARTPDGVVVPLDSPGTDELGRAGLPGKVNRHFWQRFGAAMLVSIIDAGTQAGVQASNSGGGAVIVNPSASEGVMTEVLKSTVNIPPTVVKRQGDRIQVLVARDLDFRSVYALRSGAARR
ncbi:MAG TPA: type IV secretion system protein VirB10 [Steroidobacteraceae bacterium]|nr:type IV secretion system protein VirB10 [Steroidobacteraceae bacterium]